MGRDLQLLANVVEAYIDSDTPNSTGDWAVRSILAEMYETPQRGEDSLWERCYDVISNAFTSSSREWNEE